MSLLYKYQGQVLDQSGASMLDGFAYGSYWNRTLGLAGVYLIDSALPLASNLLTLGLSHYGEVFSLSRPLVDEIGHVMNSYVPSTATGTSYTKAPLLVSASTLAVSNYAGGSLLLSTGIRANSSAAAGNTQGYIAGLDSSATIEATADATAYGARAGIFNAGGTGVSTLNTALSKVVLRAFSAGNAQNSAFMYCVKDGAGAIPPVNCYHGVVVDGASVSTTAFCVASGSTPTSLWARDPLGKRLVSVTSGSGAGPIAGGTASHITVTTVSQTAAAGATGTPVVVNTTAVTANSRIIAQIINYSGTLTTNGLPVVYITALSAATSFTFAISNAHSANALSGTVTVAFTIEN
jgi:hypothetical protein